MLVGLMGTLQVSAAAEESVNVEMSFSTNKDTYKAKNTIKTTLKLRNHYPYPITNVSFRLDTPEGYSLKAPKSRAFKTTIDAGKTATYSIDLIPEAATKRNGWVIGLIIAGSIIVAGGIAFLVVFFIKKKKLPAQSAVSMLLVCAILVGLCAAPIQVHAANVTRYTMVQNVTVNIDGTDHFLTATVIFDNNPLAEEFTLNTTDFGYSDTVEAFTTTPNFECFYGTLKQPKQYSAITLDIYNAQNTLLHHQSIDPAKNWTISDFGLCPGMNRVCITAVGDTNLTLEFMLYDYYGLFYDKLEGYDVDTDGDGLFDLIENNIGTDINKVDTDGDKLTDYDEFTRLGLDPLNADTDGNG